MTNPLPSRCWTLLGRYIQEFKQERLSGSITLRLELDRGVLSKWRVDPSFSEQVQADKGAA